MKILLACLAVLTAGGVAAWLMERFKGGASDSEAAKVDVRENDQ